MNHGVSIGSEIQSKKQDSPARAHLEMGMNFGLKRARKGVDIFVA
jgi:hypothetical protein